MHKLIVATRRAGAGRPKAAKDAAQAGSLIQALVEPGRVTSCVMPGTTLSAAAHTGAWPWIEDGRGWSRKLTQCSPPSSIPHNPKWVHETSASAGDKPRSKVVPGEQRMTGVELLDASRQARLLRLAGLAAQALDAPAAVLAISGLEQYWVHAPDWPILAALPDDQAFQAHVLAAPDAIAVSDARCDPRLAASPLVTGAPGIRFCAGVPLLTSDQTRLGTLCVLAMQPRRSEPDHLAELQGIAELIVDQIEQQREARGRALAEATAAAERKRLAAVVESLPFNFWMCDATGRYVLQNSVGKNAWGAHVGLLPEETAVPATVSARWAATNRRALAGETIRAETCYIRDGEAVRRGVPGTVCDAAGKIWGLVGVNLDIGERRRAEERLQASEARLRTAIESLPFDFWICDAAGRYIMNNATCRSHWGSHIGQTPAESDVTPEVTGCGRRRISGC